MRRPQFGGVAYRSTLRDGMGRGVPAGHVHTPILRFGADNHGDITDGAFERNRAQIVDQVRAIVAAAVAHR